MTTDEITAARDRAVHSVGPDSRLVRLCNDALDAREKLAALYWLGHGGDATATCEAEHGECSICSVLDCPQAEPLHYHHDGCPACTQGELSEASKTHG